MSRELEKVDKIILAVTLLLIAFGIIFIYSTSFTVASDKFHDAFFFAKRQAVRGAIGLVLGFFVMQIDYHKVIRWGPLIYFGGLVALFAVFLPGVRALNGSRRWIEVLGFSMQVSELARLALVVFLAMRMGKLGEDGVKDPMNYLVLVVQWAVVVILIAIEPDLSSSVFVAIMAMSLMFIGGVKKKHLLLTLVIASFSGFLFLGKAEYRLKRFMGFLNQEENAQGSAFHMIQGKLSIGSGGFFGAGIGEGVSKNYFVPEPHTDFIFSTIAQEVGFVGISLLSIAFMILIFRGFRVAKLSPDREGQLLAAGITLLIAVNFFAHTAVNLGMAPTTGIPLPFISYGGMSLVFTIVGIAVLLNISSQTVEGGIE